MTGARCAGDGGGDGADVEESKHCALCRTALAPALIAEERMFGMGGAFHYGRCPSCGVVSLQNGPTDLSRFYPSGSYCSFQVGRRDEHPGAARLGRWLVNRRNSAQLFGIPVWARPLARWRPLPSLIHLSPWLQYARRDLGLGLRILDIGCGSGELLHRFESFGFSSLHGLDPYQGSELKQVGTVTIRAKHATDLRDEEFDLIILNHSLEHIHDQVATAQALARVLSPAGVIRMEVPVIECDAFEEYGSDWVELDAPRHLHLHTRASLRRLAQLAGLDVIEMAEVGGAFEFWGSEMYRRGLTYFDPSQNRYREPTQVFDGEEMRTFEARAGVARERGRSGRVRVFLKRGGAMAIDTRRQFSPPKWFDELVDFRLALHTAEPYVEEPVAQETAALSSPTDGGAYTWMIHMYPPKHNAGAEMMVHAINSYLIRRRQAHVNVILNEQSITMYDRVNLIWAKDRVGCTRAVHEANVLLSHLDNEANAAQTAVRARKPLVLVMHNSGRDPWLEEFKKTLPGNLYLIHNSLWIQRHYARHELPGVVLYPPVDWRDYLIESSREYVTLINLSENKGGNIFLQLVQRMSDIQFLGVKGAYDPQVLKEYRNLTVVENTPEIKEVYSRTGILLMPSKYESWGRTAVEAMSSGIPVIAHPTPGLVESCRDGGIFCSRDDLDAWEREIRRLKQDEAYYAKRSEACRRRAMELDPEPQLAAMADWLAALKWKEPLM